MAHIDAALMKQVFDVSKRQGKRTYIITARRMISGLDLKYRKGECLIMRGGYKTALPASSRFSLTRPPYISTADEKAWRLRLGQPDRDVSGNRVAVERQTRIH